MALPAIYPEDVFLDKDYYTEDEYFTLDDQSQTRLEFLPEGSPNLPGPRLGRIRAMREGQSLMAQSV